MIAAEQTLALKPEHAAIANDGLRHSLERRLGEASGRKLHIRIIHEVVAETPATRSARARSDARAVAAQALAADPIIQDMQRQLGAQIIPESIRPVGRQA